MQLETIQKGFSMKALVLESYNHFVYQDVETPVPGPGEVRIRIMACSVCGSDVKGMDGSTGRRQPPIIMGHEASGIIESVGPQVVNFHAGDRVTFDSTIYCNHCEMCRNGLVNLCDHREVIGVSCDEYRHHGAMAEYLVVPEYVLYRIPDSVTYQQAAMVEPMSVAYHAVTRCPVPAGGSAMVVGVGTIGLFAVQILKSLGVQQVIAVDIAQKRLDMARRNGADIAIDSRDPQAEATILSLTGGKGVDAAYDATGIESTALMCTRLAKLNGSIVFVGNIAKDIHFPLQYAVTHQLSFFGSCASAGEYDQCLALIAEGKVDVDAMISGSFPLAEGDKWMHKVYNREDNLDKILLLP